MRQRYSSSLPQDTHAVYTHDFRGHMTYYYHCFLTTMIYRARRRSFLFCPRTHGFIKHTPTFHSIIFLVFSLLRPTSAPPTSSHRRPRTAPSHPSSPRQVTTTDAKLSDSAGRTQPPSGKEETQATFSITYDSFHLNFKFTWQSRHVSCILYLNPTAMCAGSKNSKIFGFNGRDMDALYGQCWIETTSQRCLLDEDRDR
ncbi:unnamed protein product [Lactuca virosa]|uniref:Uncharacterized protein n=1 Tax=Lactuca virosa TaxID=75947 RepID=A0AAU9MY10_9ASTR|nr:unnamed protein product [Lactuca virosa]